MVVANGPISPGFALSSFGGTSSSFALWASAGKPENRDYSGFHFSAMRLRCLGS